LLGPGELVCNSRELQLLRADGTTVRLSLTRGSRLALYGEFHLSTNVFRQLLRAGVEVALLSRRAQRLHCQVQILGNARVMLRHRQHRAAALTFERLEIARWLVAAKMRSIEQGMRQLQRHSMADCGSELIGLRQYRKGLLAAHQLDEVRGYEGTATAAWWRVFGMAVRKPYLFMMRKRRPAPDPVNAMLGLASTLLCQRVAAELTARGLELFLGFLHRYRAGRPSLACDMMEPLRVRFADRWVLSELNQRRVMPDDFEARPNGGLYLRSSKWSRALASWERSWLSHQGPDWLGLAVDELCGRLRGRLPNPPAEG